MTDIELVGGFTARYFSLLGNFEMSYWVSLNRWVDVLGRNGYVGVTERAEAGLGFSVLGAMRDTARLTIFGMQTTPLDTDDRIGWGGLEIFIPIGLIDMNQEIAYRMAYMAVIDEARFGQYSRAVFEAMLTAGVRF